jgi:DnaJ-class molecular chaperone
MCLHCAGKGYSEQIVPKGSCPTCNGTGEVNLHQWLFEKLSAAWEATGFD